MNIIITKFEDHSEVSIRNASGIKIHTYVFDTHDQAESFMNGWRCCQIVINSLVQGLPQTYTLQKV